MLVFVANRRAKHGHRRVHRVGGTPYVNSWDEYVSRYSTCSYECFFISHHKQVHFGYYTKSCELAYLTESRLVCCEGYFDYGGDCYPVCKSGCPNGRCTGPDQCTCNEGYVNVLNECKPKCSSCENGRCVAPNECVCDEGFRKDSNAACVPSCKDACIGGLCDRDGHCACSKEQFFNPKLLEFGVRNGTVCTGRCDKPCQNGYCVGRNRCQCLNGYQPSKVDSFACTPVCDPSYVDCTGGVCVAPNTCICKTGYTLISGKCVPICDPECISGNCVSPGQCSCLSGYHKIQESDFECIPTCDPPCNNGKCVSPNTCECFHGFAGSLEVANRCEATCDSSYANCDNGTCVAPNYCKCNDGYMFQNGRCIPNCDPACINGECSSPNECSCLDGFTKNAEESNVCIPSCTPRCENGDCVAPNTCKCHRGFEMISKRCSPTCDPKYIESQNGRCIAPNVLLCDEGFALEYDSGSIRCAPSCNPSCTNARCLSNGLCQCFEGFIQSSEARNVCEPACDPSCVNSSCVRLNQCECWEGHQRVDDNACHPICDAAEMDCTFGSCIGVNVCLCSTGYALASSGNNTRYCSPTCSQPCNNGVCTAPNVCECHGGYNQTEFDEGCTPVCEESCENAICSAPDVCSCLEGFVPLNSTVCTVQSSYFRHPRTTLTTTGEKKKGFSLLKKFARLSFLLESCLSGGCQWIRGVFPKLWFKRFLPSQAKKRFTTKQHIRGLLIIKNKKFHDQDQGHGMSGNSENLRNKWPSGLRPGNMKNNIREREKER
ncbi:conserved hypothetical protein [Culex quinquefasciatus]|uniref:EGF-like domain-containing protein n=1 Tax=Culex quinquefasciatus TaxID=7176 RepID=B0WR42_CULQU|nr:conserved hypothetical protein [Culex quinquefasciatus]|eukprot:XP_001851176.1 conserved hypothetical protein [Culex quinquefasciatus]